MKKQIEISGFLGNDLEEIETPKFRQSLMTPFEEAALRYLAISLYLDNVSTLNQFSPPYTVESTDYILSSLSCDGKEVSYHDASELFINSMDRFTSLRIADDNSVILILTNRISKKERYFVALPSEKAHVTNFFSN